MPKIVQPTHQVQLTKGHLQLMAEYIEVIHRAICGQYKPLFDLIQSKTGAEVDYNTMITLEQLLLSKF